MKGLCVLFYGRQESVAMDPFGFQSNMLFSAGTVHNNSAMDKWLDSFPRKLFKFWLEQQLCAGRCGNKDIWHFLRISIQLI